MAVTRARSHGRESVFQCPMTHGGAGSARHRHKQHTVLVKTEPGGPHAESRRQHRGSGRIRPAGPGGRPTGPGSGQDSDREQSRNGGGAHWGLPFNWKAGGLPPRPAAASRRPCYCTAVQRAQPMQRAQSLARNPC